MSTLEAIQSEVEILAAKIGAPPIFLPTYDRSEQSGRPHIEVSRDGQLNWVVCERGIEFQRKSTLVRDELFYWIFDAVTAQMASHYEVRHRIESEDFRKQMFTKQFELLDLLNPIWTARRKLELGQFLHDAGI